MSKEHPDELNEGNLEDRISSLVSGLTTLVDPAVVAWCREDKEIRVARETIKGSYPS